MIYVELEYSIPDSDWIPYRVKATGEEEEDYRKVLAAREADQYTKVRCEDFASLRALLREAEDDILEIVIDDLEAAGDENAEEYEPSVRFAIEN